MNPSNGKGSRQRPTDYSKFSANWDRIFAKKEPEVELELIPTDGSCTGCYYDCGEEGCSNDGTRCVSSESEELEFYIYKQVTNGN